MLYFQPLLILKGRMISGSDYNLVEVCDGKIIVPNMSYASFIEP